MAVTCLPMSVTLVHVVRARVVGRLQPLVSKQNCTLTAWIYSGPAKVQQAFMISTMHSRTLQGCHSPAAQGLRICRRCHSARQACFEILGVDGAIAFQARYGCVHLTSENA
jgi:hypothetical protein